MSATQLSSVALRVNIIAALTAVDGDSLDQINSSQYPDGAEFFVLSTKALYRLDKTSTQTASATVIASNGGPGRFMLQPGGARSNTLAGGMGGTAALAAAGGFTVVASTWIALTAGSSFYVALFPSSAFSVAVNTGILTYTGPASASYKVSLSASIASATASDTVELAATVNGALIGTTSFVSSAAAADVSPTTAGEMSCLAYNGFMTLAAGDTLQPVVRNTTAGNNLTVKHVSMTLAPL